MKSKLTVNRLALGNLKARKKQYTIMIIGIILAMIFSSSAIFLLYSMRDSAIEKSRQDLGSQYKIISIKSADKTVYDDMKSNKLFSDYGLAHNIGFAYSNDKKLGAEVGWLDDDCKRISYLSLIDGVYPMAENEIAIEKSALLKLGYEEAKIGDTIKLKLIVQDDFEYLDKTVSKEYKLVGIVNDKRQNMYSAYQDDSLAEYIPSCFVAQGTNVELGGKERILCYHNRPDISNTKNGWDKYNLTLDDYYNSHKYEVREEYIGSSETLVLGTGTELSGNLNFITILSVVLMLASCLAIINAFNSNLKERRKQIGMLRAIGTTRRQIINIFGREALIISIFATPFSIAISYGIVSVIMRLLGDNLVLSRNMKSLALCIALNLFVVMLSALVPLIKISKTSPIQAIRNTNNNRKMKTKHIKSSKSYDMSSLLARRYRTFYKSSNAIVCVILIITIVFSCIFMGFADGIMDDDFLGYGFDYAISGLEDTYGMNIYNRAELENGLNESEMQTIRTNPYVKSVSATKKCFANIMVDDYNDYFRCIEGYYGSYGGVYDYDGRTDWTTDTLADMYLTEKCDSYNVYKSMFNFGSDYVPVSICAVDDEALKKLEAYSGEINIGRLDSGAEVVLLAPKNVYFGITIVGKSPENGWRESLYTDEKDIKNKEDEIVLSGENPYSAGDEIRLSVVNCLGSELYIEEGDSSNFEKKNSNIKIGAIVSSDTFEANVDNSDFAILTTYDGMRHFSKDEKYDTVEFNCNTEITDEIDREVTELIQSIADVHNGAVSSLYELKKDKTEEQRTWYLVIISIVILSFSICAGIINNTITANIRENKRELGTLRAVGADQKSITMSYIKQLLSVFATGYGIGFALYIIYIAYVYINDIVIKKLGNASIGINPWLTIVFCVLLFAICSVNLWAKIKKEMKNSIVENIREL